MFESRVTKSMPSYKPVGELVNVTPEHPFEEIRDREAV